MRPISVTILPRSFGSVGLLLSSELAELYPDSVRVLDVGVAAAGLLHLLDYRMACLVRLRERGVQVFDRERKVVEPFSGLVFCVELLFS